MWRRAGGLSSRPKRLPVYGGDPGNRRYSRLAEIDTGNASKLAETWVFDTRPTPAAHANRPAQATPLVVNGVMYVVTAHQSLVALDPETGKPIWIFAHQHVGRPPRGVAYWPGDRDNPARILFGTYDGFLLAVNAKTGKAIPGFGNEGEIDLKVGMKDHYPDVHYGLSGAPVIYKNLAITGSHTQDSPSLGSRGDARAWDVAPASRYGPSTRCRSRERTAIIPGSTTAGETAREPTPGPRRRSTPKPARST